MLAIMNAPVEPAKLSDLIWGCRFLLLFRGLITEDEIPAADWPAIERRAAQATTSSVDVAAAMERGPEGLAPLEVAAIHTMLELLFIFDNNLFLRSGWTDTKKEFRAAFKKLSLLEQHLDGKHMAHLKVIEGIVQHVADALYDGEPSKACLLFESQFEDAVAAGHVR